MNRHNISFVIAVGLFLLSCCDKIFSSVNLKGFVFVQCVVAGNHNVGSVSWQVILCPSGQRERILAFIRCFHAVCHSSNLAQV